MSVHNLYCQAPSVESPQARCGHFIGRSDERMQLVAMARYRKGFEPVWGRGRLVIGPCRRCRWYSVFEKERAHTERGVRPVASATPQPVR